MSNKPRINDRRHSMAYPTKYAVYRFWWMLDNPWVVDLGENFLRSFPTHAEALAFAIKEAGQ